MRLSERFWEVTARLPFFLVQKVFTLPVPCGINRCTERKDDNGTRR